MRGFFKQTITWVDDQVARPKESGNYLTRDYNYGINLGCPDAGYYEEYLHYSKKHDAWNVRDSSDDTEHKMTISHWAHISDDQEGGEQ